MLIHKTEWFRKDVSWFCASDFSVCVKGVKSVFKVPSNAVYVRFYIYDKPTRNTAPIELNQATLFPYEFVIKVGHAGCVKRIVRIPIFLGPRLLGRTLDLSGNHYYAECEYTS